MAGSLHGRRAPSPRALSPASRAGGGERRIVHEVRASSHAPTRSSPRDLPQSWGGWTRIVPGRPGFVHGQAPSLVPRPRAPESASAQPPPPKLGEGSTAVARNERKGQRGRGLPSHRDGFSAHRTAPTRAGPVGEGRHHVFGAAISIARFGWPPASTNPHPPSIRTPPAARISLRASARARSPAPPYDASDVNTRPITMYDTNSTPPTISSQRARRICRRPVASK